MIKFLIHDEQDMVGVAVADIKTGEAVIGKIQDSDKTVEIKSVSDIPLGHKIALRDMAAGERVIKYHVPIGKTVQAIKVGEHVHTHNLKTERW
ncbi:UxaA family hydrolase [Desulforamulus aquiferis]|uniref:UxaA family hydrolase n=1 Tax=Desulforamulus aquiferis TaxID=1397668 RepID=A0AAW7ZGC3_9FIRM|nr:UxaA family hydrolase [Desulforamulus aquiferis]MDO7788308.1 UxaA family hydrolase [Desulforamulus aquiferis]